MRKRTETPKDLNHKKGGFKNSMKNIATVGTIVATLIMVGCKDGNTTTTKNQRSEKVTQVKHNEEEKNNDIKTDRFENIDSTILWNPSIIENMEKNRVTAEKIQKDFQNKISKYDMLGDSNDIDEIILKGGEEKNDEKGKYLQINGEKYYKWNEGINGKAYILLCYREYSEDTGIGEIKIPGEGERGNSSYIGECSNGTPNGVGILITPRGYEYGVFKNGKFTGEGYKHEEPGTYDDASGYADYFKESGGEVVKFCVIDENNNLADVVFQGKYGDLETIKSHGTGYEYGTAIYHNCAGAVKLPDGAIFKSDYFQLVNPYFGELNKVILGKGIIIHPNGKKEIGKFDKNGNYEIIQELE